MQRLRGEKIAHFRILILEYDEANAPFKNQTIKVKKRSISSIHLNQKTKRNLPGGESNPGLPRDRRGYSPLYYRRIECV